MNHNDKISAPVHHVAQDATQEAFVRAYERWSRLRGQPWVSGWLIRTAINEARRSIKHEDPRGSADQRVSASDSVDESVDLWRAVRTLPSRQQQAVVLYYSAGFSTDEVAKIMGCRGGTARGYLTKARERLRTLVGNADDEGG